MFNGSFGETNMEFVMGFVLLSSAQWDSNGVSIINLYTYICRHGVLFGLKCHGEIVDERWLVDDIGNYGL